MSFPLNSNRHSSDNTIKPDKEGSQESILRALLATYQPEPKSDLLENRILARAKKTQQTGLVTLDNRHTMMRQFLSSPIKLVGLCIMSVALGLSVAWPNLSINVEEHVYWQEAAADLDLADIYLWVETDE